MGKFTLVGVDEASGMTTSLVVQAVSQEEAVRLGVSRGMRVLKADTADVGERAASHADMARLVEELQGLRQQVAGLQQSYQNVLYDPRTRESLKDMLAWGIVRGLLIWLLAPAVVAAILFVVLSSSGALASALRL